MPRYTYDKLIVACRHSVEPFDFGFWIADFGLEWSGRYLLRAQPFLRLIEIEGRTPREVWDIFDKKVDDGIESLVRRG